MNNSLRFQNGKQQTRCGAKKVGLFFSISIPHSWLGSNSISISFPLKDKRLRTGRPNRPNTEREVTWNIQMHKSKETGGLPSKKLI